MNERCVGGMEKLYMGYQTRFVGVGRMKVGDEFFCMFKFGGGTMRVRHRCSHILTNGQGRVVCRIGISQS